MALSEPIMDPVSGKIIGTGYTETRNERTERLAREIERVTTGQINPDYVNQRKSIVPPKSIRAGILEEAARLVDGERDQQYAPPKVNFTRIAALWGAYNGNEYTPQDVAIMMALLKISRLANNDMARDSWVDAAGYLACGAECVQEGVS